MCVGLPPSPEELEKMARANRKYDEIFRAGVSEILCLSQFHNVVCFPGKAVRLWNVVEQANCLPEGFAHPIHFILV